MARALELDEELSIEEGGWRSRAISFGALLLLVAFGAAAVWYFFLRDEEVAVRPTEDITVAKGTIATNLLVSGTADTELNSNLVFQTSGKVSAVNVKVGDVVRQDQILAALESEDLANAVQSAEANATTAQLKLQDLLDGASDADLAAANQGVAQAEAALTKARNDLTEVQDGADAADISAAEQAVSGAESQLKQAESALNKMDDAPSAADLAAAQAGVAAAESALTSAENAAENAENSVNSASASLKSAETTYCGVDGSPAFCTTRSAPISSGDATIVQAALVGPNATEANSVIAANSAYLNAVNGAASADAAVEAAQESLDSANERLQAAEDGPSDEDVDAAEAAVAAAEASLASATARLADVKDGASSEQIATAAAAVDSAEAGLASAKAKQAEAVRGPEKNTIDQARQGVATARLQVDAARIRLKNAQIIAPFEGTVAAVNISAGEFTSQASAEPAIILLTPDRVLLQMDVGETDYASLKPQQGGIVIFDGLPGKPYPFTITTIGLTPSVNQGVVTYPVKATIVILPGNPKPVPGMNGRGQLTTDSKPDILLVPPRAIRRRAAEQVVDVRRDGTIETVVVTTGLTDPENVEIVTGLAEGDVIVVPKLLVGDAASNARPTLPGGVR